MAVKTRLTNDELKRLRDLFGHSRISLLYKGSVHGFEASAFHSKTDCQGPTVVVAYNSSKRIYGGYTQKGFSSSGNLVKDEQAFLFGSLTRYYCPKYPVKNPDVAIYNHPDSGPNFGNGSLVFLSSSGTVTTKDTKNYNLRGVDLHENDLSLVELEAFRVEDAGIMDSPWRSIVWTTEERNRLLELLNTYESPAHNIPHIRVLMIGPVGAGKSSFFNSVNSVFRGHVVTQARTGCTSASMTKKYRTYQIKVGKRGLSLPIMLCDTIGLEKKPGTGLEIEDIIKIIKGHVPDRYQFNTAASINSSTPGYIESPALKDKIHIVVFVLDACEVGMLSEEFEEKLKQLTERLNDLDVPQLVLLTKVDELCPAVAKDINYVYKSNAVEKQIRYMATRLEISPSVVLPIKNYCHELELENKMDILILQAVQQISRMADLYFDNLEEDEKSP